jgi:hypothetical protein
VLEETKYQPALLILTQLDRPAALISDNPGIHVPTGPTRKSPG